MHFLSNKHLFKIHTTIMSQPKRAISQKCCNFCFAQKFNIMHGAVSSVLYNNVDANWISKNLKLL